MTKSAIIVDNQLDEMMCEPKRVSVDAKNKLAHVLYDQICKFVINYKENVLKEKSKRIKKNH